MDIVLGALIPLAYVDETRIGIKFFDGMRNPSFMECSKGKPFFGGDSVGYLDIMLVGLIPLVYVGGTRFGIKLFDNTRNPLLEAWVEHFGKMEATKAILLEVDMLRGENGRERSGKLSNHF